MLNLLCSTGFRKLQASMPQEQFTAPPQRIERETEKREEEKQTQAVRTMYSCL